MAKTAFIFDLDGVIVDTAKYHFLAWKKLAREIGFDFTEEQNELFKGVSRKRCLEILLELGNVKASEDQFATWMEEKNNDYLSHIAHMNKSEILPHVPEVLTYLKAKGYPLGVGSASKNAHLILEKVGLLSYFNTIVDGTQVVKAKPDPQVFLKAADDMRIKPEYCVVFEDAIAGIKAANKAGMTSIGIGKAEVLSEAAYVFKDFTEIDENFLDMLIRGTG